jgi:hypothetical protein
MESSMHGEIEQCQATLLIVLEFSVAPVMTACRDAFHFWHQLEEQRYFIGARSDGGY